MTDPDLCILTVVDERGIFELDPWAGVFRLPSSTGEACPAMSQLPDSTSQPARPPVPFDTSRYPSFACVTASQSRCRLSDNPCARRSANRRPGSMRQGPRSMPRRSRTSASTATPKCSSRASLESREGQGNDSSEWLGLLTKEQLPRSTSD
jgi:hypothetical protein